MNLADIFNIDKNSHLRLRKHITEEDLKKHDIKMEYLNARDLEDLKRQIHVVYEARNNEIYLIRQLFWWPKEFFYPVL